MTIKNALRALRNAVLDLQSSDYNTYERPLKKMSAALQSAELTEINDELKSKRDLNAFLDEASPSTGMVGSARLDWPEDHEAELGLTIQIIEKAGEDPDWFTDFAHQYYYAGSKIAAGIHKMSSSLLIPFERDYKQLVMDRTASSKIAIDTSDTNKVFIVHGHDEAPRETVARFITTLGLVPIILHEQASKGQTIPEKLQTYGAVGFAVVLLTPDDTGRSKNHKEDFPRARQNVILELGYFLGRLGRDRVCALLKESVEIPSDFHGVVYTDYDKGGAWKLSLAKELKAVGYDVDLNKAV